MDRIDYRRLLPGMDSRPLLSLYRRSIAALGDDLYSGAQRAAWARWADNTARADEQLRQGLTVLAMANGTAVGFAQLFPGHLVNMLYVDEGWQKQGIGKGLVTRLEIVAQKQGTRTLSTRASSASFSLFHSLGFESARQEWVHADGGITIARTLMHKSLAPGGTADAAPASIDDDGSTDGLIITRKGHNAPPVDQ